MLDNAHSQSGISLLEILFTTCLLALAAGACLKLENSALSQAAKSTLNFKKKLQELSWSSAELNPSACSPTTHWSGMTFIECQKASQTQDQSERVLLVAD